MQIHEVNQTSTRRPRCPKVRPDRLGPNLPNHILSERAVHLLDFFMNYLYLYNIYLYIWVFSVVSKSSVCRRTSPRARREAKGVDGRPSFLASVCSLGRNCWDRKSIYRTWVWKTQFESIQKARQIAEACKNREHQRFWMKPRRLEAKFSVSYSYPTLWFRWHKMPKKAACIV